VLGHEGQGDQQQQDERDGGQERVERDGAGQERQMAFVGGLKDAADEPPGREVPPAAMAALQARGSS
jgi:hypothetical protein